MPLQSKSRCLYTPTPCSLHPHTLFPTPPHPVPYTLLPIPPHPVPYTHTPCSLHPHTLFPTPTHHVPYTPHCSLHPHTNPHTQEMPVCIILHPEVSKIFPGMPHPSTLPYVCCSCSCKLCLLALFLYILCLSPALFSAVASKEF